MMVRAAFFLCFAEICVILYLSLGNSDKGTAPKRRRLGLLPVTLSWVFPEWYRGVYFFASYKSSQMLYAEGRDVQWVRWKFWPWWPFWFHCSRCWSALSAWRLRLHGRFPTIKRTMTKQKSNRLNLTNWAVTFCYQPVRGQPFVGSAFSYPQYRRNAVFCQAKSTLSGSMFQVNEASIVLFHGLC